MVHGDTSFWNSHPAKSGGCCCFEIHFTFCSHLKGNGWLQSRQQVCDLTFGGISHYIHLDLATTVTSVNKILQDKSKNWTVELRKYFIKNNKLLWERDILISQLLYCLLAKLRTEFNSPIAKCTVPKLSNNFLCTLSQATFTCNANIKLRFLFNHSGHDYDMKMPKFMSCRGREHKTTTFFFLCRLGLGGTLAEIQGTSQNVDHEGLHS